MTGKNNSADSQQALFSEHIKNRHHRWWIEKQRHPFKQLGGKLRGREYAKAKGIKVPELFGIADSIEEICEFSALPERFVLKPNRGWSAKNVFVLEAGVNALDGGSWTREKVIAQLLCDPAMSQPGVRFLAEEYLVNWDGKKGIPYDYKFYMFGSDIAFIHVIERNSGSDLSSNRHWFLTPDWQTITKRLVSSQEPQLDAPPEPDCLEELFAAVKLLGTSLNMFMRIDMYATTRGAVFGEFTPQPHGGSGFAPWADVWLGSLWRGVEGVAEEGEG